MRGLVPHGSHSRISRRGQRRQSQTKERTISITEQNERKHLFAMLCAAGKSPKEAAIGAGFPPETAEADGLKLLGLRSTKKLVRRFAQNGITAEEKVRAGLDRLAFGEVNDVMEAVLSEDPPGLHRLLAMNFFNISEVKKVKGGGLEVKFFDRQKAMEKLLELYDSRERSDAAKEFFSGLSREADDPDEQNSDPPET